jgi:predicted chitinase
MTWREALQHLSSVTAMYESAMYDSAMYESAMYERAVFESAMYESAMYSVQWMQECNVLSAMYLVQCMNLSSMTAMYESAMYSVQCMNVQCTQCNGCSFAPYACCVHA